MSEKAETAEDPNEVLATVVDAKPEVKSDSKSEVAATWPDSWRDNLAGGDQKLRARLDRFADPNAILQSMLSAEQKIRSGEYKKQIDKTSNPEELAQWREENGVPESWDKYPAESDSGVIFGDDDMPTVDAIRQWAHENDMPAEKAKGVLGLYAKIKEQQEDAIYERDEQMKADSDEDLRAAWGGDYKRNMNIINGLFDSAPEGFRDQFATARMADGTPLGNHPGILKWLAGLAREVNPMATVVPGTAVTAGKTIDSELAAINEERKKDIGKFMVNESLRARERELLDAKAKLSARR